VSGVFTTVTINDEAGPGLHDREGRSFHPGYGASTSGGFASTTDVSIWRSGIVQ
jgi:hypothetical protein